MYFLQKLLYRKSWC